MKRKIISIILILSLLLVLFSIAYKALEGRIIQEIESTFENNKEDFDYVTNLLKYNNKEFLYLDLFYEFNDGLCIDYCYADDPYNFRTVKFDYFFDKILLGDKDRIYTFMKKNNIKMVSYNGHNRNNVKFVMWIAGSRARGIMYSDKILNKADKSFEEFLYLNNIDRNYYSFEVK